MSDIINTTKMFVQILHAQKKTNKKNKIWNKLFLTNFFSLAKSTLSCFVTVIDLICVLTEMHCYEMD